jgi:hypothetical protein
VRTRAIAATCRPRRRYSSERDDGRSRAATSGSLSAGAAALFAFLAEDAGLLAADLAFLAGPAFRFAAGLAFFVVAFFVVAFFVAAFAFLAAGFDFFPAGPAFFPVERVCFAAGLAFFAPGAGLAFAFAFDFGEIGNLPCCGACRVRGAPA